MGSLCQLLVCRVGGYNNAAWVQVVVQSLGFAQKFRAENNIFRVIFLPDIFRVTDRYRGLNNHDGIRIDV